MQAIRPGTPLMFFDLAEIEEMNNVHHVVVPAVKHWASPVLTCGDLGERDSRRAGPWASRSVVYDADERLFKMWYCGYPTASGRAATRPQRFDFDGDGGAHNICVENIGSVVKDDAEADPKRRYKLFLKKPQGNPDALGVAYSRDGVRWASRRTETGLAKLPVDRFTALETRDGESPGHALTAPLALPEQPCRLLAKVSSTKPPRSWCSIDFWMRRVAVSAAMQAVGL